MKSLPQITALLCLSLLVAPSYATAQPEPSLHEGPRVNLEELADQIDPGYVRPLMSAVPGEARDGTRRVLELVAKMQSLLGSGGPEFERLLRDVYSAEATHQIGRKVSPEMAAKLEEHYFLLGNFMYVSKLLADDAVLGKITASFAEAEQREGGASFTALREVIVNMPPQARRLQRRWAAEVLRTNHNPEVLKNTLGRLASIFDEDEKFAASHPLYVEIAALSDFRDPEALRKLSLSYARSGDPVRARLTLKQAISNLTAANTKIDPTYEWTQNKVAAAESLIALNDDNLDDAIQSVRLMAELGMESAAQKKARRLALYHDDARVSRILAKFEIDAGRLDNAEHILDEGLAYPGLHAGYFDAWSNVKMLLLYQRFLQELARDHTGSSETITSVTMPYVHEFSGIAAKAAESVRPYDEAKYHVYRFLGDSIEAFGKQFVVREMRNPMEIFQGALRRIDPVRKRYPHSWEAQLLLISSSFFEPNGDSCLEAISYPIPVSIATPSGFALRRLSAAVFCYGRSGLSDPAVLRPIEGFLNDPDALPALRYWQGNAAYLTYDKVGDRSWLERAAGLYSSAATFTEDPNASSILNNRAIALFRLGQTVPAQKVLASYQGNDDSLIVELNRALLTSRDDMLQAELKRIAKDSKRDTVKCAATMHLERLGGESEDGKKACKDLSPRTIASIKRGYLELYSMQLSTQYGPLIMDIDAKSYLSLPTENLEQRIDRPAGKVSSPRAQF